MKSLSDDNYSVVLSIVGLVHGSLGEHFLMTMDTVDKKILIYSFINIRSVSHFQVFRFDGYLVSGCSLSHVRRTVHVRKVKYRSTCSILEECILSFSPWVSSKKSPK